MKNTIKMLAALAICPLIAFCTKPSNPSEEVPEEETQKPEGFVEAVPNTIRFTNAEFLYNGDDIGEGFSDGWIVKLYTDMEIDESGAPVGPGSVMQLLLNVRFDEEQSADPTLLPGRYTEMINSGNFAAGTFVNGYMTAIDLPGGEILRLADATFYADLAKGSTEMDYDLLDEGALIIEENQDGTYTIEGVLVGNKYTKRYFIWEGQVAPENNVPEVTPDSTLESDIVNLTFTRGQLHDKGDYFYLKDESYRCLLLFLVNDGADLTYNRPGGTGEVLRLEFLVPWDTDYREGIPEGSYEMIPRNPDTSMDKDKIVPGGAVAGLPHVFEAWKMAGSWYYELEEGEWNGTYARIDKGTISVTRTEEGSHTITYDLEDCQNPAKRITGTTELNTIEAYETNF